MAETRTQLEKIEKICKDGLNRYVGAERGGRNLLSKAELDGKPEGGWSVEMALCIATNLAES
jgi:hypothetical protein